MTNKTRWLSAVALSLMVAACGTDPQERVTGGAAAGAATGAGIGALGGPPGVLAGAAIGAGAGAVTGATTTPQQVNLGRPVWDDPNVRIPSMGRRPGTVREAQSALAQRGFDPGPADGVFGARSQAATAAFQRANNIEPTGSLTGATLTALNVAPPAPGSYRGPRMGRRDMGQRQGMQGRQMENMGTQGPGSPPINQPGSPTAPGGPNANSPAGG